MAGSDGTPLGRFGVGVHPTSTLKRRKGDADHRAQRDCRVCKSGRTTLVCSSCRDGTGVDLFFCGPKTGRGCFNEHLRDVHEIDVSVLFNYAVAIVPCSLMFQIHFQLNRLSQFLDCGVVARAPHQTLAAFPAAGKDGLLPTPRPSGRAFHPGDTPSIATVALMLPPDTTWESLGTGAEQNHTVNSFGKTAIGRMKHKMVGRVTHHG